LPTQDGLQHALRYLWDGAPGVRRAARGITAGLLRFSDGTISRLGSSSAVSAAALVPAAATPRKRGLGADGVLADGGAGYLDPAPSDDAGDAEAAVELQGCLSDAIVRLAAFGGVGLSPAPSTSPAEVLGLAQLVECVASARGGTLAPASAGGSPTTAAQRQVLVPTRTTEDNLRRLCLAVLQVTRRGACPYVGWPVHPEHLRVVRRYCQLLAMGGRKNPKWWRSSYLFSCVTCLLFCIV
jgi:hypothetical protein